MDTTIHQPTSRFDRVVLSVIVLNTAALVWGLFDEARRDLAEQAETLCLVFFVCELALRLGQTGWSPRRFLSSRWNGFDTVVIILAVLPLGVNVTWLRVMRGARILHSLRHISHLRLADLIPHR